MVFALVWASMAVAQSKPVVDSFFALRVGKALHQGQDILAAKAPVLIKKGYDIEFIYQEAEIINIARVLTAQGELMLETKSLDGIIYLATSSLPAGRYTFEVSSGEQRAKGLLVVK
jgi:hypothetical protein